MKTPRTPLEILFDIIGHKPATSFIHITVAEKMALSYASQFIEREFYYCHHERPRKSYLNPPEIPEPCDDPTVSEKKIPHCCPVCGGKGFVQTGFYSSYTGLYDTTSITPENCRTCNGSGFIWQVIK